MYSPFSLSVDVPLDSAQSMSANMVSMKGTVAAMRLIHVQSLSLCQLSFSTVFLCSLLTVFHVEGGTLFHVSELINAVIFSNASITIIDGQNKEIIANSTDNDYNPCLPQPLYLGKRVTVTFSSNITSFGDWFPAICSNDSGYSNEYMFDGAQQWTINNLIVEDYDSGNGYFLIHTGNWSL